MQSETHDVENELRRIQQLHVVLPRASMPDDADDNDSVQKELLNTCIKIQRQTMESINKEYQTKHKLNANGKHGTNCTRCVAVGYITLAQKKPAIITIPAGRHWQQQEDKDDPLVITRATAEFENVTDVKKWKIGFIGWRLTAERFVRVFDPEEVHKYQKRHRIHKDNLLAIDFDENEKEQTDHWLQTNTKMNRTSADYTKGLIIDMLPGWKTDPERFRNSIITAKWTTDDNQEHPLIESMVPLNNDDEFCCIMRTESTDQTQSHVELLLGKIDALLCVDMQQSQDGTERLVADFLPHLLPRKVTRDQVFLLPLNKEFKLLNQRLSWDETGDENYYGFISIKRAQWLQLFQWFVQRFSGVCLEEWFYDRECRDSFIQRINTMDDDIRIGFNSALMQYAQLEQPSLQKLSKYLHEVVTANDCRPWNMMKVRQWHSKSKVMANLVSMGLLDSIDPVALFPDPTRDDDHEKYNADPAVVEYVRKVARLPAMRSIISRTYWTSGHRQWIVTLEPKLIKKLRKQQEPAVDAEEKDNHNRSRKSDPLAIFTTHLVAVHGNTTIAFPPSVATPDHIKYYSLNYRVGSKQMNMKQGKRILYFQTEQFIRENNIFLSEIVCDLMNMLQRNEIEWRNKKLRKLFQYINLDAYSVPESSNNNAAQLSQEEMDSLFALASQSQDPLMVYQLSQNSQKHRDRERHGNSQQKRTVDSVHTALPISRNSQQQLSTNTTVPQLAGSSQQQLSVNAGEVAILPQLAGRSQQQLSANATLPQLAGSSQQQLSVNAGEVAILPQLAGRSQQQLSANATLPQLAGSSQQQLSANATLPQLAGSSQQQLSANITLPQLTGSNQQQLTVNTTAVEPGVDSAEQHSVVTTSLVLPWNANDFRESPVQPSTKSQKPEEEWVAVYSLVAEQIESATHEQEYVNKVKQLYDLFKQPRESVDFKAINEVLEWFTLLELYKRRGERMSQIKHPFIDVNSNYDTALSNWDSQLQAGVIPSPSTLEFFIKQTEELVKQSSRTETEREEVRASVVFFMFANFLKAGYGLNSQGTVCKLNPADLAKKCFPNLAAAYKDNWSKLTSTYEYGKWRFYYWYICMALDTNCWRLLLWIPSWSGHSSSHRNTVRLKNKPSHLRFNETTPERMWLTHWANLQKNGIYEPGRAQCKLLNRLGCDASQKQQHASSASVALSETTFASNSSQTGSSLSADLSQPLRKRRKLNKANLESCTTTRTSTPIQRQRPRQDHLRLRNASSVLNPISDQEWECERCDKVNRSQTDSCRHCNHPNANFKQTRSNVIAAATWRCTLCEFDNLECFTACTVCSTSKERNM